mmetsp:Transcript_6259/g.7935  ORF Transcript_6259/g.7935 Transcript_6259/m.7935 type:complete len:80 (+) Transcript_6259:826-1065(+)
MGAQTSSLIVYLVDIDDNMGYRCLVVVDKVRKVKENAFVRDGIMTNSINCKVTLMFRDKNILYSLCLCFKVSCIVQTCF